MSVLKGEGRVSILFGTKSVTSGAITHDTYLARPDHTGEWPTIVLVPTAWGVTSSIKDVARRLARHGIAAVVVDPYRGARPRGDATFEEATAAMAALPMKRVQRDIADVVRYIVNPAGFWSNAEHGFAMLGAGAGGPAAARSAAEADAGLVLVSTAPDPGVLRRVTGPILGLAGKDDEVATAEAIAAARAAAPHAEWVRYEGLGGDFFDDARDGFDQQGFDDALERIVAFADKHLPPPG